MYIFGGRTEEGADLGDLAAFRISSRRWYTFQNMGPSPSPRSGHSMTTVGKSVIVVGGEPSSAATAVNDLGLVYALDSTKIRYPNDAQIQSSNSQRSQQRRPSASEASVPSPVTRNLPSRDGSNGPPDTKRLMGAPREAIGTADQPVNGFKNVNGVETNGVNTSVPPTSKLPRAAAPAPVGPPPTGPTPAKPTVTTSSIGRIRGPSKERAPGVGSPRLAANPTFPTKEASADADSPVSNGRRTPTQTTRSAPKPEQAVGVEPAAKSKPTRQGRSQGSVDSTTEPGLKAVSARPASPPPPTRQPSNPLARRSSGRNSQTVALLKELDSARNRNAWYASELELARKSGYVPNASLSPILDSRATETFDDEDKPLIEALLAMRSELANVQSAVDKQAILAAKQIAEADKQRDAAIQEAVYAKAKLAAHMGGSAASTPQMDGDRDMDERSGEISKKLASSLSVQKELKAQLETIKSDLAAEKKARQLADDTTNASQRRMTELESYKQQTSTETERLKAELHKVQREAREKAVACAEAVAALQLLTIEKDDFKSKYDDVLGSTKNQNESLESIREAMTASMEIKNTLERKLDEERTLREKLDAKHSKLKAEHEARTAELVAATQRLRDVEELAEKHAAEAKTHRQALLSGLDKISARDASKSSSGDADRIVALQGQLNAANVLVKKYQQEADAASDRLRSAEERIAGLEVYQEQSSREGVAIRRQLQAALRETQTLQAASSDLKHQLANQQLETNAMTVQHNTLKDILSERGISPTSVARTRGMTSPRASSPEQGKIRDLEQQLSTAMAAHEETKQFLTTQQQESEAAYREKLSQLENDYQSAVHYVKGTEKMLKQLKEQLARYKTENTRLKTEVDELEEKAEAVGASNGDISAGWEKERAALEGKVNSLQADLKASTTNLEKSMVSIRKELEGAKQERDSALKRNEEAARTLNANRRELDQLQQENQQLEKRAQDAEIKVNLLLDQVETSVDNYRRRSRQVPSLNSDLAVGGSNGLGLGHNRNESSEGESVYGSGDINARNSTALDNLANELETLRSHWEATNKNYRLSNAFDFENAAGSKSNDDNAGLGLSESLADWRKRLDVEEREADYETKTKARPDRP
jgi:hypothetical protein